jgi:hypothetical protein
LKGDHNATERVELQENSENLLCEHFRLEEVLEKKSMAFQTANGEDDKLLASDGWDLHVTRKEKIRVLQHSL